MRVDRIFEGGTLLTMDAARPRATALTVLGGRIVAVGDADELRRHLDAARVVSLQGRTMVPGFHDAHNHMPAFGMGLADVPLSSPSIGSVEDILRAVKARAASQPPGSWIVGGGYDQKKLAEGRHPRAADLDAGAPEYLVWLRHTSGHMCVVGGRAAFREADTGSLEPGKLADFAVLSADPTAITPDGIAGVEVLATVVNGRVLHDRMGLG